MLKLRSVVAKSCHWTPAPIALAGVAQVIIGRFVIVAAVLFQISAYLQGLGHDTAVRARSSGDMRISPSRESKESRSPSLIASVVLSKCPFEELFLNGQPDQERQPQ